MLASDDPEAVKHKLLDLMKQAKEQWECVLQLTATSKEIADRDRMLALQKKKAEIEKSLADLRNDPDRAKLAKEIMSRQNPKGKLEVRKMCRRHPREPSDSDSIPVLTPE